MMSIEHLDDKDQLRQIALLLDRENARLHEKVRELARRIAALEGQTATAPQLELAYLKELLAQRERALFAAKSEQRPRATSEAAAQPEQKEPQRGHGPRAQAELPIVEQPHELAEADQACPKCGGELAEMTGQTEDSKEITVVERRFVIALHRRQKYRCACNGHVATAPGPLKLAVRDDARGNRYSIDFAVEVVVGKYLDHLPLERQARMMGREGLEVSSQTLWDQIEALARGLGPTYEALRRRMLEAPVVGVDETWWRLMQGKGSKRWWAWTVASPEAVVYRILDSRSQEAARQVLDGYRGVVLADGYGAYTALASASPSFTLAHCWAHVRRKYVEAEPHFPEPCAEILNLIGQLYGIERQAGTSPVARAALRSELSRPIVEQIHDWAYGQRALPQSSLGKAIDYTLGLWPGLTRFLDDGRIPIDNNATERALRGAVLGRKNHYGSRSRRGTEVAALFYSLLETAKLADVEPKQYLRQAVDAALRGRAVMLPYELAG